MPNPSRQTLDFRGMRMRRLLIACFLAIVTIQAPAQELPQIGSSAELWAQRTAKGKVTYLEGVCEGLDAFQQYALGELFCSASQVPLKGRFCLLVNTRDGKDAVAYVDRFYRNRQQTDIPIWAVIGTYNDDSCSENVVTSRLPKMQKILECRRQSISMARNQGVASEAIKAQQAHCKDLEQ